MSARRSAISALNLELTGPGGLRIARDFTVGVRPAQSYQLRRFVGRLEPGQSVTLDDNAADEFLPGTAEALLTVSPRPDWDVPGLLRALDRYAYGCLEQTTSRALPLLYVDAVAGLWRTDPGFTPAETIDRAIGHVVELQRGDGSFGVWSDTDDTVPWLDAYATDFLIRAKEHGKNVPDFAIKAALGWLRDYVRQEHTKIEDLPAVAYAHYVLARGRAADLPTLRYFNDTQLAKLPTQLAMAQLGAALAQAGDVVRASTAYDAALGAAADAAGRASLCRLRQRAARQRRRAGLCRRQSGEAAAAHRGDGPHRRAVRARQPHQHPGAGLAPDGGRGGGARERRHDDDRDRRRRAANGRQGRLPAPRTRHRRRAGHDRQSRRDPGMANRVDHRRSEGRSAGGEQRLHRVPRRV